MQEDHKLTASETSVEVKKPTKTLALLEALGPLEEEAARLREAFMARLSRSHEWIENILRKKYSASERRAENFKLPEELEWVLHYCHPQARFRKTVDGHLASEGYTLTLTVPMEVRDPSSNRKKTLAKDFYIHDVFVRGDMWEACKFTRSHIYLAKTRAAEKKVKYGECRMTALTREHAIRLRKLEKDFKREMENEELSLRQARNRLEAWPKLAEKLGITGGGK